MAWLGKLWKIVFGYIDVRAPRMADPKNAIPLTYFTNTRYIALSYVINMLFLLAEVRILELGTSMFVARRGKQFPSYPRKSLLAALETFQMTMKYKKSPISRASLRLLNFGSPCRMVFRSARQWALAATEHMSDSHESGGPMTRNESAPSLHSSTST